LVDSGSTQPEYVARYNRASGVTVVLEKENIGFSRANNLAFECLKDDADYVAFVNPDAFLLADFFAEAVAFLERLEHTAVGAVTGVLLGYDLGRDRPTGLCDSAGIFRSWYGRRYDRYKGQPAERVNVSGPEPVPAICGALMFCRTRALRDVLIGDLELFDSTFFMYKEDIDLSLRLRGAGWELILLPRIAGFHCRGWKGRASMSRQARVMSARNELRLEARNRSPFVVYALLKYFYVVALENHLLRAGKSWQRLLRVRTNDTSNLVRVGRDDKPSRACGGRVRE
jgi:GT2 family glycosyltransferase